MQEIGIEKIEERVRGDLDAFYVATTGGAVGRALVDGRPVEANYQPGDGTRYGLVFVPLWNVETAPGRVAPIRGLGPDPRVWDSRAVAGGAYEFGWTMVALDGGFAAGLNLAGVRIWHPGYLEGRWGRGPASSCALALLFDAVREAMP